MLRKTSYAVAGMALTLAASALATIPATAQEVQQVLDNKLIPMNTHGWAEEVKELEPEVVAIARVRGKVGDILSLEMMYPESVKIDDTEVTHLNLTAPSMNVYGYVQGGDDVVVAYKDGAWMYIGKADYATYNWITRLNLKAVPMVQQVSIDWGESKPVALPPVEPRTVVAPAPVEEPIRGMW